MYRLKKEYKGKVVALANPPMRLDEEFVLKTQNQGLIIQYASQLSAYIEHSDGSPIADVGKKPAQAPAGMVTSKDVNVKEAVEEIEKITDVEDLLSYTVDDGRKGVADAFEKRLAEIQPEPEASEKESE